MPDLPPGGLWELFRRMLLIRRFGESLIKLAGSGHSFPYLNVYLV